MTMNWLDRFRNKKTNPRKFRGLVYSVKSK